MAILAPMNRARHAWYDTWPVGLPCGDHPTPGGRHGGRHGGPSRRGDGRHGGRHGGRRGDHRDASHLAAAAIEYHTTG